jgi:hypothetical protein
MNEPLIERLVNLTQVGLGEDCTRQDIAGIACGAVHVFGPQSLKNGPAEEELALVCEVYHRVVSARFPSTTKE